MAFPFPADLKSGERRLRRGIAATTSLVSYYVLANDNACEETFYPKFIMLSCPGKSQIFQSCGQKKIGDVTNVEKLRRNAR
jgi:hypothetical protein